MRSLFFILIICFCSTAAFAQQHRLSAVPDTTQKMWVAEASCGRCQFHMKDNDCRLAVRIDGKAYFVDGAGIDDFGDAHGKNGFCNAIRKANVQGSIVKGRFKLTYFKLLN